MELEDFFTGIVVIIFLLIMGSLIGACFQAGIIRRSAIQAGVAEWVIVDKERGINKFRWITNSLALNEE